MILSSFFAALGQMGDPRFRHALIKGGWANNCAVDHRKQQLCFTN